MENGQTALFIGRFQPFHLAHLEAVKWIAERNERVIIAVGSAQYATEPDNPFSAEARVRMIEDALADEGLSGKCTVVEVSDLNNPNGWVKHVDANVPKYDIVYSNNEFVKGLMEKEGKEVHGMPVFVEGKITGTKVRQALDEGGSYWQYVPAAVAQVIEKEGKTAQLPPLEMKIAIAQVNTAVNAVEYNADKAVEYMRRAKEAGAELVVFPEMTLPGYPPKDLLLSEEFVLRCQGALEKVRKASEEQGIAAIVGGVERHNGKLYNTAFVFSNGRLIHTYHKRNLPNYDVFDEKRYFAPGEGAGLFELNGKKIGLNICEDIWIDGGPADMQAAKSAQLIINISASPFYFGKTLLREEIISRHYKNGCRVPIVYVNQVGGQDDIVFDGQSYAFNGKGKLIAQARHFEEDLVIFSTEGTPIASRAARKVEEVYQALVLGLRDFAHKNRFSKAILGLSGGIDSAIVAVIAADALGAKNVKCVSMPSEYTSSGSKSDAAELAYRLGVKFAEVPIMEMKMAYERVLGDDDASSVSVAEENLQARIRANILYYYSNKDGYLALNTSNKSEAAVGYGTLYGDMAGGFAVISDVPKTLVYELCYYINEKAGYERIPLSILTKAPSAELKPGQLDSDSLPPYPILDRIIGEYVEKVKSPQEIVECLGEEKIDEAMVREVIRKINAAEHKRKQSPPGTKITQLAFGTGRRMPIAKAAPITS